MKKLIIMLLFLLSTIFLWAFDPSTPETGNLYYESEKFFSPNSLILYEDETILGDFDLKLINRSRIFRTDKKYVIFNIAGRTEGTDIAWISSTEFVALTGNTRRYSHGILGDQIESSGFTVYKDDEVIGRFEISPERVFETLRPLITDLLPENPGPEIILTGSSSSEGARIELYNINGEPIGYSPSIGRGYRWLHIIAAGKFGDSEKKLIAVVRTPHINGILELYIWNGKALEKEAEYRGVSSHQIGSDNLNMAIVADLNGKQGAEFLLPSLDYKSLLLLKYENETIKKIKAFELPERLSTNLFYDELNKSIWAGVSDGRIIRLME